MPAVERNDYLELEILKEVELSPQQNNRALAAKLGCNVRLTHSLLKKLINHGYLEVKKLNSRNWHYFLTSEGFAEKARKTYKFFEFSMNFYQDARESSSNICKALAEDGRRNIAFIGSGNLAEIVFISLKEWKLNLIEVYDEQTGKKQFMGIPIQHYKFVPQTEADAVMLCRYKHNGLNVDELKKNLSSRFFRIIS